ncbi:MAG: glycosyltransferase family 4 protein, partial [Bacteroidales bacterium]|nr:glycosyltransferase family 4 protein [Bacteroidales bacterium]
MHILFITEVSPFPTNGGERMRCTGLLKALSDLGHNITAIVANNDAINLKKYSISKVNFIEYNFQKWNTNNLKRLLSNFRKDKRLLNLIAQIIKKQAVDIVFIDYFFLGQYISYFRKKDIPVIYGTHNAQALLTLQDISGNLPNRLKKSLLYVIHYSHERRYFNKANILIAVSKEDKQYYERFINQNQIKIIPNFIDFNEYEMDVRKKNYIIITGNFFSFQNKIGVKWFVKKVWQEQLFNQTE